MYSLIQEIIADNKYSSLDVVCHFPLNMLIKNPQLLNDRECRYAMNPATHLDFLIYNRISKKPVLAIEVDGYECNLLNLLYCVLLTAHFQSQPTSVSFLPLKLQH